MQILIKKDLKSGTETVLNIFYGENNSFIDNWINEYLKQEIDSLNLQPYNKNIKPKSIEYSIKTSDNEIHLIKKYKTILKGYIYNSSEKIEETLFSFRYLHFDGINTLLENTQNQTLWNGINSEISHRVLKQLDKDSLYNINLKFEAAIKTKEHWTSTELVMLKNELTKSYKKELYSSVVKKMKKFEKKQQNKKVSELLLPCKTIEANGDTIKGTGGLIPDMSRYSGSCALEYHIINKKEKFE